MIGLPSDQTSVLCQQGNWVNDEQIDCQDFLDFVFGEGTCPKRPLEPGVYIAAARTGECFWEMDMQYVLVKPSGQIYVFLFQYRHFKSLGTSIQDLWSDISLYRPQSEALAVWEVKGSEIAKILPEKEFRRLTQPRPFSICLVGSYGGGPRGGYESSDGAWVQYWNDHAQVLPDGSVHWTPGYDITYWSPEDFWNPGREDPYSEEYLAKVGASGRRPEPTVLQVGSVSRADGWTVKLHPGQVPRLEVIYPPLCVLKMTNGQTVDLYQFGFNGMSALLSSTRISYLGSIKETEGSDCIVSFPGKYADGWRECVEASSHDMGVACVFLCG